MRSYKKTCQINAIFWNVPKYDKRNRAIHTVSSYIGLYNSWKIWIFLRINLLDIFQKKICFENSILKCKPLNLLFKCKSIGTFYTWKKFFLLKFGFTVLYVETQVSKIWNQLVKITSELLLACKWRQKLLIWFCFGATFVLLLVKNK